MKRNQKVGIEKIILQSLNFLFTSFPPLKKCFCRTQLHELWQSFTLRDPTFEMINILFSGRAWREKLEQAEIRKREETKELQVCCIFLDAYTTSMLYFCF